MFGRRPTPDSDAVALARRRLAALAAEFEGASPGRASSAPIAGSASIAGSVADDVRGSGAAGRGRRFDDEDDDLDPEDSPSDGRSESPGGSGAPGPALARARTPREVVTDYGRWGLTSQHVTLIALVLVAALAVTAWYVLRSQPHATPVQLTNERSTPSTPVTPPPLPGSSASPGQPPVGAVLTPAVPPTSPVGTLVVDVTGKVRRPGIVELPVGSRVVDALRKAGGARAGVRTDALNLARLLVDGEQIVVGLTVPRVDLVPVPGQTGSTTTGAIAAVDLNTASQEQLETLPGIGPVTATAILQWRTEHGRFTSVNELLDVSGIGDVTLANIEAYVHV